MADITIERSYIDNNTVKEYVSNVLVEKFFPDIDVDLRTVGMIGYVTELIANTSEDSFNTTSVLFRETFPNRAQLKESIYSHAALFQIDDVFSSAAACKFLIVLEEAAIINNLTRNDDAARKNEYEFFIDKNTVIFVEGQPFTIDYDIRIVAVRRRPEDGIGEDRWIFSAEYVTSEYNNSLSSINEPYIRVRRSIDGYMALEVWTHQCIRDIREDEIIENVEVNFPVLDFKFSEQLAGFDILYKEAGSDTWVQLDKKIVYSQPQSEPFCYYQIVKEGLLRISFNTKDTFFMPEFNSQVQVILYITEGQDGNFDTYNGNNISIVPNYEKYKYNSSYLVAATPVGASQNGSDEKDIEALQALTVEGYRTANALTTDNDLQLYFNNYKYRFGNSDIFFIRKRDDIYERIFSAFMIVRNGSYVYHTNSLHLKMNMYDMTNNEKNVFILEPGTVFTANDTTGYGEFYRNQELYDQYYSQYQMDVANNNTPFIEDTTDRGEIPAYLDRPCSFAQWKRRHGYDDTVKVWELTEQDYSENDIPSYSKFLLINPFLIKFTKSPNLVSTYITCVNNTSSLDFVETNDDMFMQFAAYTLKLKRGFTKEKVYNVSVTVTSTSAADKDTPIIKIDHWISESQYEYYLNDKYALADNDFRLFFCIYDNNGDMVCYSEMTPAYYDNETDYFTFTTQIHTDDHITSTGKLRILPMKIYRNKRDGSYYKAHENDETLYDKYDKNGYVTDIDISKSEVTALEEAKVVELYEETVNTSGQVDMLIPINECVCKVIPIYKRNIDEETGELELNEIEDTNHPFIDYDDGTTYKSYERYIMTNVFSTAVEPVIFIKSLESIRSTVTFEDYTEATKDEYGNITFAHDIFDINMLSIGFIAARTTLDDEVCNKFFEIFMLHYNFLQDSIDTRLRNQTGIDIKFYNTYGKSRNFVIGEDEEQLDTVNISLSFDVWFIQGTDIPTAINDVKYYIKEVVESVNDKGMNDLFISNLMRKVEIKFSYVDHMRFKKINAYNSTYQAIKNRTTDLTTLTVEERRWYVPELLVCELEDIEITEYIAS